MNNKVNHPNHYNIKGKKECIKEMEDKFGVMSTITFCLMNSYKYLYRMGLKDDNPKEQDLEKARWYYDYALGLMNGYNANFVCGTPLYKEVYHMLFLERKGE